MAVCHAQAWPCRGLCRYTVPCLMSFPSHDTLCVLRYNSPAIKPLPQPRYRICIMTQLLPQPNFCSCQDTTNCIVTFSPAYCLAFISITIQFGVLRHNPPLANMHSKTAMSRYSMAYCDTILPVLQAAPATIQILYRDTAPPPGQPAHP